MYHIDLLDDSLCDVPIIMPEYFQFAVKHVL